MSQTFKIYSEINKYEWKMIQTATMIILVSVSSLSTCYCIKAKNLGNSASVGECVQERLLFIILFLTVETTMDRTVKTIDRNNLSVLFIPPKMSNFIHFFCRKRIYHRVIKGSSPDAGWAHWEARSCVS